MDNDEFKKAVKQHPRAKGSRAKAELAAKHAQQAAQQQAQQRQPRRRPSDAAHAAAVTAVAGARADPYDRTQPRYSASTSSSCCCTSWNGRNTPHTMPRIAKSSLGFTTISRSLGIRRHEHDRRRRDACSVFTVASSPSRAAMIVAFLDVGAGLDHHEIAVEDRRGRSCCRP